MGNKVVGLFSISALATLVVWAVLSSAQVVHNPAKGYNPPRMADGHPDLSGTYDLATITPLVRRTGFQRVLTDQEAAKLEAEMAQRREQGDAPLAGDRSAPPKGGNVGGYNSGWTDPGSRVTVVNGEKRSSIVVDPADGRVPPLTPGGKQRFSAVRFLPTSDGSEIPDLRFDPTPGAYDDPERRPLAERCILGFGSTSGPPTLPDYFYNNLHQIVQTPDSIMILSEMVHDARIVRMNAQHLPSKIRLWLGDSVGRWEGDTLVIDTTNFTDKTRFRGSTQDLHVVERFTRTGPRTLLYQFTIEDPATWTRPWSGEYTWPATDAHIFEYACHEGNYALKDILKGARDREREQAQATAENNK